MTDLLILSDPFFFLRFLEVPQKGGLKIYFLEFFNHIFLHVWSYRIRKNFFKSPGSWHECRPIYGLHFVYIVFYPLYKKGGLGGPNKFHHEFLAFFFWPF